MNSVWKKIIYIRIKTESYEKEKEEIKKRHPPIRRERPEVVRLGGRTRAQMERIRGTVKGRKTHSKGCLESWRSPSLLSVDQERWAWGGGACFRFWHHAYVYKPYLHKSIFSNGIRTQELLSWHRQDFLLCMLSRSVLPHSLWPHGL